MDILRPLPLASLLGIHRSLVEKWTSQAILRINNLLRYPGAYPAEAIEMALRLKASAFMDYYAGEFTDLTDLEYATELFAQADAYPCVCDYWRQIEGASDMVAYVRSATFAAIIGIPEGPEGDKIRELAGMFSDDEDQESDEDVSKAGEQADLHMGFDSPEEPSDTLRLSPIASRTEKGEEIEQGVGRAEEDT